MKATATFIPSKWDEKPYGESGKPFRMTKAAVEYTFKGEFEGKALTDYVMFYREYDEQDPHKSTATYVGLTRYEGTLNGKSGSFVTEDRGTFEGGVAKSTSIIIAGSGAGDLKGIRGNATGAASRTTTEFRLDYSL